MSENENCSRPSGTHPKKEATLSSNYAAKANAGVAVLKEAARRARGDVFASIVCPLITRRAAPIEHIGRTSLFLESYIIPRMLKNSVNIGIYPKKAIVITPFSQRIHPIIKIIETRNLDFSPQEYFFASLQGAFFRMMRNTETNNEDFSFRRNDNYLLLLYFCEFGYSVDAVFVKIPNVS